MKQIDAIRAALQQAGDYIRSDLASERGAFEGHEGVSRIDEIKVDLANNASALAKLAELERAAADLAISLDFYKKRCDALQSWQSKMRDPERTIVCDILANGFTLDPPGDRYTPAPVAEIREVVVTDESLKNIGRVIWISEQSWVTHAERGRTALAAVRAELGPTLGLIEIREPTPEECERIGKLWDSKATGLCRTGRDMFDAVCAVMWPKEGL